MRPSRWITPREQTATVHVEGGLPVRGWVVFSMPREKPAPDIALSIYKTGVPLSSGTLGMDVLDIRATTDAEGRFEIPQRSRRVLCL